MSGSQNEGRAEGFLADCARIHGEWHERAKSVDTEGLLAVYSKDVVSRARWCRQFSMTSPTVCFAAMPTFVGFWRRVAVVDLMIWYGGTAQETG